MAKNHLLTDDELRTLKQIKIRKTVTSDDADVLEAIYKRMNPKYELCKTCLDTLAAEASSLVGYAEKQLGHSLREFENEERIIETVTSEDDEVEHKEITVTRTIDGKLWDFVLRVPADTPNDAAFAFHINGDMVVSKTEVVPVDSIEESDKQPSPPLGRIELDHDGIYGLTNEDLIKYVFQETGTELSEHADRGELISSACDLLEIEKQREQEEQEKTVERLAIPESGISKMKNDELRAYIEQETGTYYGELNRPELQKLAKQAQKNEKSK